jgi:hypothetical protein
MDYAKTTRRVSFRPALLSIFTVVTVWCGVAHGNDDLATDSVDPLVAFMLADPQGIEFDCYRDDGAKKKLPPSCHRNVQCTVGEDTTDNTCQSLKQNYCKEFGEKCTLKPVEGGRACEKLYGQKYKARDKIQTKCKLMEPSDKNNCDCPKPSASADIDLSELPASN